jgi:monoterpene epsilon-lactone hydrolase
MPSPEHEALRKAFEEAPTFSHEWDEARREHAAGYAEFPLPDVPRERVDAGGVPSEWFRGGAAEGRAILYVHGGGFVLGSSDTHAPLTARLAERSGVDVLSVEYRLAPEHPAPAAAEDVVAAHRWLLDNGYAPERVAWGGDSAGGGVALSALQALGPAGLPTPSRAVLLSGVHDLALETGSAREFFGRDPLMPEQLVKEMFALYRGELPEDDPRVSPLHGSFEGLPPLLVMAGSTEVLRDDSIAIAERARAAGVEVELEIGEELMHVWPHYAHAIPEGREAIDRIAEFLVAERSGVSA